MSNPGEREDAPEVEFEDVADEAGEQDEQSDGAGSDEDGADADEGDEAGDGDDAGSEDASGNHEGQARQSNEVKPRSAATIAVQEAKRAAKAAEARAAELERRLNEQERQRQGQLTAQQQAEERARLELMPPEEKTEYLLNKQRQEFDGRFGQLQFQMQDNADRIAFENLCARDPSLAGLRDQTEQKLAEMRRNGATAPRETIATFLLGQRARERAAKGGKAKQAAKGAVRVQSQRVAAPSGRSDVKGGDGRRGGDGKAALRARLEDQQI